MLGTDKEPGIYVRTLNDLFKAIEETSDDMQYSVTMSYLEVRTVSFKDILARIADACLSHKLAAINLVQIDSYGWRHCN